MPGNKDVPQCPTNYVVSFAPFHERGLRTPASDFFCGLLHHYGIALQNLNPNSILQIMVFVALCEGYLGIKPNFALWKYYFCAVIFSKTVPVRIGSCVI
jgi:hypothetical protein